MTLRLASHARRRFAVALGVVVGVGGVLALAAGASADHPQAQIAKHHAAHANRPCDAYFPTSAISALTGTPMGPLENSPIVISTWKTGPHYNGLWTAPWKHPIAASKIAGTECGWITVNSERLGSSELRQAWAAVGYGYTQKAWDALWSTGNQAAQGFEPQFSSEFGTLQSKAPLKLGGGTEAYVLTFDLWNAEEGDAYFVPPRYLYAVTLMTKHHNLLLLAPETASLGSVESALESVLKSHPKF